MLGNDPWPVYLSGSCEIDLARRELRVRGTPVPVGGRTFEILELLVQSGGELVSKGDLIGRVWQGALVEDNALQFHVSAIRKALGTNSEMLKTISGRAQGSISSRKIRRTRSGGPSPAGCGGWADGAVRGHDGMASRTGPPSHVGETRSQSQRAKHQPGRWSP